MCLSFTCACSRDSQLFMFLMYIPPLFTDDKDKKGETTGGIGMSLISHFGVGCSKVVYCQT